MESMKLTVVVGNVGQLPKLRTWPAAMAPAMTENSPGKRTLPSGVVPLASTMRRVAPATVELELHLTLPPTCRASCRWVETAAGMLFESVSEHEVFGGWGRLRNTRMTQRRHNSLSWFRPIWSLRPVADDPYTQERPKSGVLQQSVNEEIW
jgi:hypothetical protein